MANESVMEIKRHELLEGLHELASAVLKDHGIAADVADQAGAAVAAWLAEEWGGQVISIPKDYSYKLATRDVEIYERFNGRNWSQLARDFGMTERGIRKVVQRIRAKGDPNQPRLF